MGRGGRTSAPRAALAEGSPRFGFGSSSTERCLSSSSLPAKRKSSVSIRGARLGQGPAACGQHLADIWQGTRWGSSPSAGAWEPAAVHMGEQGTWGTSSCRYQLVNGHRHLP